MVVPPTIKKGRGGRGARNLHIKLHGQLFFSLSSNFSHSKWCACQFYCHRFYLFFILVAVVVNYNCLRKTKASSPPPQNFQVYLINLPTYLSTTFLLMMLMGGEVTSSNVSFTSKFSPNFEPEKYDFNLLYKRFCMEKKRPKFTRFQRKISFKLPDFFW